MAAAMAAPTSCCVVFFACFFFSLLLAQVRPPTPAPWPPQFHSLLYINSSGALQVTDLWYDWPNGRNFNVIQAQLKSLVHDLEWTNGTSFVYDLQARTCRTLRFGVGILRPNWLDGAAYVGVERVDGFACNVWTKADFITYWEDIETKRPVHWLFYSGMSAHVITFEIGAVLEDAKWQAPVYCFSKTGQLDAHAFDPLRMLRRSNEGNPPASSVPEFLNKSMDPWKRSSIRWLQSLNM